MSAVRAALFAEAGVTMLRRSEEAAAIHIGPDADPRLRADAMRLKVAATRDVESLRAVLFPEDDDER